MTMTNAGLAENAKLKGLGLGGTKFDAMAIGTDATAPAATQTALVAEITTGGGARRSAGDVTETLLTTDSADDTVRYETTWTFSASHGINEFGVFNAGSGGVMLLRQTFADPLNVVSLDTLTLQVDVKAADQVVSADSVITFAGLTEGNKLVAADLTPANGRISAIALGGDNGTTLPLAQSNTALGDEFLAVDSNGLARAQEVAGPTVTLDTENVTDDTVKVSSQWQASTTVAVNEAGLFNATAEASGTLFIRYVFVDPLNLVNTDKFTQIFRLTETG